MMDDSVPELKQLPAKGGNGLPALCSRTGQGTEFDEQIVGHNGDPEENCMDIAFSIGHAMLKVNPELLIDYL